LQSASAAAPSPILPRRGGIFAGSKAAAAFQLSMSLSPSSGVQKKRKNPYSTPVLLGLLHFALGSSSEHRSDCRENSKKNPCF
jgi:hypothetical protein